jgi:hypothetical protein
MSTQIAEFALALRQAVYDRDAEIRGHSIRYYYDAQVLIGIILGFRDVVVVGEDQAFVRALVDLGFLGRPCVLRSHASELYVNIRGPINEKGAYRQEALGFLKRSGYDGLLEQLQPPMDGSPLTPRKWLMSCVVMDDARSSVFSSPPAFRLNVSSAASSMPDIWGRRWIGSPKAPRFPTFYGWCLLSESHRGRII